MGTTASAVKKGYLGANKDIFYYGAVEISPTLCE